MAEIEHKLQYKSKDQVPRELQRQLFRLSAKFEEADVQFQTLKIDIDRYRKTIAETVAKSEEFNTSLELNLDTFKEVLRFFYPTNRQSDGMAQDLFQRIQSHGRMSLSDLVSAAKQLKPYEQSFSRGACNALRRSNARVRTGIIHPALLGQSALFRA